MVYPRVHDQTVADDYYTAMEKVEKRLAFLGSPFVLPFLSQPVSAA